MTKDAICRGGIYCRNRCNTVKFIFHYIILLNWLLLVQATSGSTGWALSWVAFWQHSSTSCSSALSKYLAAAILDFSYLMRRVPARFNLSHWLLSSISCSSALSKYMATAILDFSYPMRRVPARFNLSHWLHSSTYCSSALSKYLAAAILDFYDPMRGVPAIFNFNRSHWLCFSLL
jgi:hypothetical protein